MLGSDDLSRTIGLQFAVTPDEPDEVVVAVINSERPTQPEGLLTRPWEGEVFEFVVTLRATGDLEVRVLGESRTIDLADFAPRKLALSCSGAWVTFSDVVVSPVI
jgi:hypothetical protein